MPTVRECLALLTNLDRFKVVIKKKFNVGNITKHDFKFTNTTVTQQIIECLDKEVKAILSEQDETTKKITHVFVIEQEQDLIKKILKLEDEHYETHGLYQIRKKS